MEQTTNEQLAAERSVHGTAREDDGRRRAARAYGRAKVTTGMKPRLVKERFGCAEEVRMAGRGRPGTAVRSVRPLRPGLLVLGVSA